MGCVGSLHLDRWSKESSQSNVTSQHLEVSLRVKLFRPKTSCKARDWILEQVALGDVDVWQSIVACTID